MKKQIVIDSDGRQKLQKIFGVSRVTVWKALNYESNTDLARKIRFTATSQMGGQEVGNVKDAQEGMTTEYDTARDLMIQKFGSRVMIIANIKTGDTRLTVDGEDNKVTTCTGIADIMALQMEAQKIANEL